MFRYLHTIPTKRAMNSKLNHVGQLAVFVFIAHFTKIKFMI